jgi:hypothetical protein
VLSDKENPYLEKSKLHLVKKNSAWVLLPLGRTLYNIQTRINLKSSGTYCQHGVCRKAGLTLLASSFYRYQHQFQRTESYQHFMLPSSFKKLFIICSGQTVINASPAASPERCTQP